MLRNGSRSVGSYPSRNRVVWAARITGGVVCVIVLVAIYLPVLALLGSASAATVGAVRIPVAAIAASTLICFVVVIGFLVLAFKSRRGAIAWIAAIAAVIAALIGSLWPLVAAAFASATQTGSVISSVQRLLQLWGVQT